jgi:hypothetical protein
VLTIIVPDFVPVPPLAYEYVTANSFVAAAFIVVVVLKLLPVYVELPPEKLIKFAECVTPAGVLNATLVIVSAVVPLLEIVNVLVTLGLAAVDPPVPVDTPVPLSPVPVPLPPSVFGPSDAVPVASVVPVVSVVPPPVTPSVAPDPV